MPASGPTLVGVDCHLLRCSDAHIEAVRGAYAAGEREEGADGIPSAIREELAWWAQVPERRPMVWAVALGEQKRT